VTLRRQLLDPAEGSVVQVGSRDKQVGGLQAGAKRVGARPLSARGRRNFPTPIVLPAP